jgi:cytochrome c556
MRNLFVLTTLATLVALGALAQTEGDYQTWMKTVAATMGSMNKKIAAKDGPGVASDAQKLEATFKEVGGFWKQRGGADDAVTFAMSAQTAAAAVAKAANADNMDEAAAQAKNLQANCAGCHKAHREGSAGAYTIK